MTKPQPKHAALRAAAKGSRAALALALASCAAAPVSVPTYDISYNPSEVLYAANSFMTLVRGNPFAVPQAAFDADVVDAMQGNTFLPIHFVTSGDPSAAYRVVMMFDPPNVTAAALCTRPLTAQPGFGLPPAPRAPLYAALCRGDKDIASAFGSIDATGGPRSPAFRRGVGQFVANLFPPRNPERSPARCGPFFRC